MKIINGQQYFTPNEVAASYGISRITLLRMLDDGLLQPAFSDGRNRYFGIEQIGTISRVLSLRELGFTTGQMITAAANEDPKMILDELKRRIIEYEVMSRFYELISDSSYHKSYGRFSIPGMFCFYRTVEGCMDEMELNYFLSETISACIKTGLVIDYVQPPFLLTNQLKLEERPDCEERKRRIEELKKDSPYEDGEPFRYTALVPLRQDAYMDGAATVPDSTVRIPPGEVVTMAWFNSVGGFEMTDAFRSMREKLESENLIVPDEVAFMPFKMPYMNKKIGRNDIMFMLAAPIRRQE